MSVGVHQVAPLQEIDHLKYLLKSTLKAEAPLCCHSIDLERLSLGDLAAPVVTVENSRCV